jgi:hypothetical protein
MPLINICVLSLTIVIIVANARYQKIAEIGLALAFIIGKYQRG